MLKEYITEKWKLCSLLPRLFQTCMSFFLPVKITEDILRNVNTMEVNCHQNCLVTNVFFYVFMCVEKKTHTGLERHDVSKRGQHFNLHPFNNQMLSKTTTIFFC